MIHPLGRQTTILGTVLCTLALISEMATGAGRSATAAEIVDRVVASVDNIAISRSDVEKQYHLELFLNGRSPEEVPDSGLEGVRDRLINQLLIEQEAEAEAVNLPDFSIKAEKAWEEVRSKYTSDETFQAALEKLGMNRQEILDQLRTQEQTLNLIDERLRPAAWVDLSEIESYYNETFIPQYGRRRASRPPPLEEVESQIREILVQKKINDLLPDWMAELRTGRRVRIHSF